MTSTPDPGSARVRLPALSMIPPAALAALRGGGKSLGVPASPTVRQGAASRAPRVVIPIDVELEVADGVTVSAIARDLSTTGVFIVTKHDLDVGAVVLLELHLPGADMLAQSRHRVSAQVVRRTETGYGMTLLEPSPELFDAIAAIIDR